MSQLSLAKALTIAGSDSGGGAGIEADLKTFHALGVYGTAALTGITAQNTLGVQAVELVSPEMVERQIDSVLSDIGADAAKTGMLGSSEIVWAVARALRRWGIEKLVVDPVMIAKGGEPLLQPEARQALVEAVLPLALVVTPNAPEAEALAGIPVRGRGDMEEAARRIHALGPRWVVVKGGHVPRTGTGGSRRATDLVYDGQGFFELDAEWVPTPHTHGTGCTFSAAITAELARGRDVPAALRRAKEVISWAIARAPGIGGGHGPTNHFFWHLAGER